jgi:hypothetical protein
MKQTIMKNVHLLPTPKPSRLGLNNEVLEYAPSFGFDLFDKSKNFRHNPVNIYITSDEKPKQGEWSLYQNKIHKCIEDIVGDEFKKIILTTDQDLINDGVQAIDDEFLEWFVKNPSCEEIKVVYDKDAFPYGVETAKGYGWYKIIIPKREYKDVVLGYKTSLDAQMLDKIGLEEDEIIDISDHDGIGNAFDNLNNEPPQETLEESLNSELKLVHDVVRNKDFDLGFQTGGIFGAKWQTDRMYSEDKVIILLNKFGGKVYGDYTRNQTMEDFTEEWFEQYKKK